MKYIKNQFSIEPNIKCNLISADRVEITKQQRSVGVAPWKRKLIEVTVVRQIPLPVGNRTLWKVEDSSGRGSNVWDFQLLPM